MTALLEAGADPRGTGPDGWTALHFAAANAGAPGPTGSEGRSGGGGSSGGGERESSGGSSSGIFPARGGASAWVRVMHALLGATESAGGGAVPQACPQPGRGSGSSQIAPVDARALDGRTPLMVAAGTGAADAVRDFLHNRNQNHAPHTNMHKHTRAIK